MNAHIEPAGINDTTEQAVQSELLAPRFYRTDYEAFSP
jgi:magnesium-protoporphyrin IX monomethyl ester (oxidative) cyclase